MVSLLFLCLYDLFKLDEDVVLVSLAECVGEALDVFPPVITYDLILNERVEDEFLRKSNVVYVSPPILLVPREVNDNGALRRLEISALNRHADVPSDELVRILLHPSSLVDGGSASVDVFVQPR